MNVVASAFICALIHGLTVDGPTLGTHGRAIHA